MVKNDAKMYVPRKLSHRENSIQEPNKIVSHASENEQIIYWTLILTSFENFRKYNLIDSATEKQYKMKYIFGNQEKYNGFHYQEMNVRKLFSFPKNQTKSLKVATFGSKFGKNFPKNLCAMNTGRKNRDEVVFRELKLLLDTGKRTYGGWRHFQLI